MKRTIFLLAAIFAFSSCEGPEGPMGPAGYNGQDGKDGENTGWYTTSIIVHKNDWILSGEEGELDSHYYVNKPLGRLDEHVYNEGTVIVYMEYEYEGGEAKRGMPYILLTGDEDEEGEVSYWTATYDFDYVVGEIGFYVTYSDFKTNFGPGTTKFHVVLMW